MSARFTAWIQPLAPGGSARPHGHRDAASQTRRFPERGQLGECRPGPIPETCSHGALRRAFTGEAQVTLQGIWDPNRLPGARGLLREVEAYPTSTAYPPPFIFV